VILNQHCGVAQNFENHCKLCNNPEWRRADFEKLFADIAQDHNAVL
jgi:hypothetical protein